MKMKRHMLAFAAVAALGASSAHAQAPQVGTFGPLDHVFLIMMENQTTTDILGNPNAPFINQYSTVANHATHYFGVGHPSAPNYLQIVGGSNFGLSNDFWPIWVSGGCVDNAPGSTGCVGAFAPIMNSGTDNAVVATAIPGSSQCNGQIAATAPPTPPAQFNCSVFGYAATTFTPKSIAHQLVAVNKSWKTYQESLPTVVPGVAGVNYSDGQLSNLSPASDFAPGPIQKLYAVKHNPFAYFHDIEVGTNPALSLNQVKDFDGLSGLWADLATAAPPASQHTLLGQLNLLPGPNLWFIVPNQCHDQHGFISGGTPICSASTDAEEQLLLAQGDAEVAKIINGIHSSPVWKSGRNVIVLVWDENDYSNTANTVVMLAETNFAANGRVDPTVYDHFSLLRTLQAGFGLPCLNHSCDATSKVMNVMFGGH
jgi:phosphatidylinositol-3-phosphatase